MNVVVVSGSPGTGKTSLARLLSKECAKGVHIETDVFFRFLSHPIDPSTEAARGQNNVVIRAYALAASEYAAAGYTVYLDGVIGPWQLPLLASHFPVFQYVLLHATLNETLSRVSSRKTQPDATPGVVARMHEQFLHAVSDMPAHAIETSGMTTRDVANEYLSRSANGSLIYVRA